MKKNNWKSFEDAKKFVHTLNLKNSKEWDAFCHSDKKPDDIPISPRNAYKNMGWIGVGDWLGTGSVATYNRKYKPFVEARNYVQKLGLKKQHDWYKFVKSNKKPVDIPTDPFAVYKNKGWKSFGDWLGTGSIAYRYKVWRPFPEARKYVRSLGLKSETEWRKYYKSGKKPGDIPAGPKQVYKKEWKSLGDWLGTGRIADQLKQYRPFPEARAFIHSLKLKSQTDWNRYYKSSKKPRDIPSAPERVYKNKGWTSMGEWLGTGSVAFRYKKWRSFNEARKFVISLKLKSVTEWSQISKSKNLPQDIPATPSKTYKDKGWKNWGDWLGTGTIALFNIEYRPFEEAREFVRSLNLKTQEDWQKFSKTNKKPDDIPASPYKTYGNKGWISMGDWIGTGKVADQLKKYRHFKEARAFIRSLGLKNRDEWREYVKSGKKPDDIPAAPWQTYTKENILRMRKLNERS